MDFAPNIILVGASVRSIAASAIRDGWRPVCVDLFADGDLSALLIDPERQLLRFQRFEDLPAILAGFDNGDDLPVVLSGGVENYPGVVTQLQSSHRVTGSSAAAMAGVRDPRRLFEAFAAARCKVPEWRNAGWVEDGADFRPAGWLMKSVTSAGGIGVRRIAGTPDHSSTAAKSVGQYVQEWIDGTPISASFVCHTTSDGRQTELLGAALQLSGCAELNAAEFHFCGNAGPLTVPQWLQHRLRDVGRAVASEFSLQGVFGIDFILNADGLWGLEVNPRITASHELHDWAGIAGASHVTLHVKSSAVNGGLDLSIIGDQTDSPTDVAWARMVIYSDCDRKISEGEATLMLRHARPCGEGDVRNLPVFLADVPLPNSDVPQYKPLCSLYVDLTSDWELPLSTLLNQLSFVDAQSIGRLLCRIQGKLRAVSGHLQFAN